MSIFGHLYKKSVCRIEECWLNYKKRKSFCNVKLIKRYCLEEIDESEKYRVPKDRRLSYNHPYVLELIE